MCPIYEYECDRCSNVTEQFVKSLQSDVEYKCDKCGLGINKRIISASISHFKGSGFYETDYKVKT